MIDLFIISGLAGLVWFGALKQGLYDYWTAVVFFITLSFLSLIFLIDRLIRKESIRFPLLLPVLLYVAACFLSLRHSFDYTATLWECWGWVYVMLAFLLFSNVGQTQKERLLFYVMSSAALIPLTAIALHQILETGIKDFLSVRGSVSATLVNANTLAGFCLFWIYPLFLKRQASLIEKTARVCALLLLLISSSWGAWIALSLGGLFLLRHHSTFRRWCWGIGAGLVLMGLIKLSPWINSNSKNFNRLAYFTTAFRMTAAEPLSGIGLGSFATAYPYFKTPHIENTRFAHSFPLQMSAETGWIGIGTLILFGFLWVKSQSKQSSPEIEDLEKEALFASLIAVVSYSMISISMDYLLNRYVLFAILGILASPQTRWDIQIRRQTIKIVFIALLLFSSVQVLTLFKAEQWYSSGYYAQALKLNPHHAESWARLAEAEANPQQKDRFYVTAWHWKKDPRFIRH